MCIVLTCSYNWEFDWLINGPHWEKKILKTDSLTTKKVECPNKCCPEHTLQKSDTAIAATITRLHQEAAQSEPTEMSEILSAPAERGSPSGPRQGDKHQLTIGFDRPLLVLAMAFLSSPATWVGHKLSAEERLVSVPLNLPLFSMWSMKKTAFHKGWPHLSGGGTFYYFCFRWRWDKLFRIGFLTLKSHFSHDVRGRLSSLVSPLSACGPHELQETFLSFLWHIVLLWFILYPSASFPFPAFLSHLFLPPRSSCSLSICFSCAPMEGKGRARACACVEIGPSLSKRSVILSWGWWACWGIREGAVGGSKDGGHGRVDGLERKCEDEFYGSQMGAAVMMEHSESAISSPMHQRRHYRCWLLNLPPSRGECRYAAFRQRVWTLFHSVRRCSRASPLPVECILIFFFLLCRIAYLRCAKKHSKRR